MGENEGEVGRREVTWRGGQLTAQSSPTQIDLRGKKKEGEENRDRRSGEEI